ncbi:6-carboxytetrahydropterin synthase QueD [Pseudofrankia sp. DC12]|uniref:6-carboxytetrahydropterin synthase QueD n=1 Tax=Pseudofrankia sp. DC12 TaxID=683315 RepID=UPI0005F890C0|nr:6-carboxytetrahydropterin synthase QueD [Pseudofrankia sp. DC12]
MFSIGKRFTFDAAHVLHGLPAGHKCGRLHGHTYTVELHLQADGLVDPGFVTDFADLAPLGRYLDEQFDHRLLNDVLAVEPTSEALAAHLFGWCTQHLAPTLACGQIVAVRVSETPSSWAEYRQTST